MELSLLWIIIEPPEIHWDQLQRISEKKFKLGWGRKVWNTLLLLNCLLVKDLSDKIKNFEFFSSRFREVSEQNLNTNWVHVVCVSGCNARVVTTRYYYAQPLTITELGLLDPDCGFSTWALVSTLSNISHQLKQSQCLKFSFIDYLSEY